MLNADLLDALTWALDVIDDNTDATDAEENPAYMAAWHHATEARDKAQQVKAGTVDPNGRTPEGFVRLVADMTIEGECQDHGHAIGDCGEEQCCNADCDTYEPSGNDDEITTLYELIATARRLLQIG